MRFPLSKLLLVWRELALPARSGLILAAAGAVLDMWAHWGTVEASPSATSWQSTGHLVVLAGMVLTLLGVLAAAPPSEANRPPPSNLDHKHQLPIEKQGGSNAIR